MMSRNWDDHADISGRRARRKPVGGGARAADGPGHGGAAHRPAGSSAGRAALRQIAAGLRADRGRGAPAAPRGGGRAGDARPPPKRWRARQQELSGQIRIGAPDGCANFLLPQVCAAIAEDNPDLEVQIVAAAAGRQPLASARRTWPSPSRAPTARAAERCRRSPITACTSPPRALSARHAPDRGAAATCSGHRIVGYIPDMIFDKELDYLAELGVTRVRSPRTRSRCSSTGCGRGRGSGIVHDFALPSRPDWCGSCPTSQPHAQLLPRPACGRPRGSTGSNRFAAALADGLRREVARLEGLSLTGRGAPRRTLERNAVSSAEETDHAGSADPQEQGG